MESPLCFGSRSPAEIVISLLPGVEELSTHTVTAVDWFGLFQHHWFLGLRNLGLLRRDSEAYAMLGTVVYFIGSSVYFASSRAFPMLPLSCEYGNAVTDAQRLLIAAAGETMLAEGKSRAGILVIGFSFLVISAAMLKSKAFSRVTAGAGMLGNTLMMVLEIAFFPPHGVGMIIAGAGGFAMMT